MRHDLHAAVRRFRRHPAFAVLVVLTLAVAIGLNATLFALLDALIHPDMAMANADRLYQGLLYANPRNSVPNTTRDSLVAAAIGGDRVARHSAGGKHATVLEHGDNYLSGSLGLASANFFEVAGIRAIDGRLLGAPDTLSNNVVLTDSIARLLFAKASPVGATMLIDGKPHTVVGVVSSRAQFPHEAVAVWKVTRTEQTRGYGYGYQRLIRLRDGETIGDVFNRLQPVAEEVARRAGEDPSPSRVAFRFHPAVDVQFQYQRFHIAIAAGVVAVLLVACFNLGNIQLARAMTRRRELATHVALGASVSAMVRQAAAEAALLALPGFALGVAAVAFGARLLGAIVPRDVGEFVVEPHLSWRVVAFSVIVTAIATALMAIAPALLAARVDPAELLKSQAGTGQRRKNRRQYAWLVVLQLGSTLALASGAAVMLRSMLVYNAITPGYETKSLVTGSLGWTGNLVSNRAALDSTARLLQNVADVAAATAFVTIDVPGHAVTIRDSSGFREIAAPRTHYSVVSSGYVEAMKLPISAGRNFDETSRDGQVLIDEPTAKSLWPNGDAIGQEIKLSERERAGAFARVVGVIGARVDQERRSAFGASIGARAFRGMIYRPGVGETIDSTLHPSLMEFIARASGDARALPERIRRQLISAANVRGSRVELMDDASGLARARDSRRFVAGLFVTFALLASALLAVGIHGILAYGVADRRREIAVRIAIGARSRNIVSSVLRESVPVVLLGVALGLLLTKLSVGLLASQAIENDIYNAPLFAIVALVVSAVVAGAAIVPTVRATRIAPVEGLRGD